MSKPEEITSISQPQSAGEFRVLMVLSRRVAVPPGNGRERTLSFIMQTCQDMAKVEVVHLESWLQAKTLRGLLSMAGQALAQLLRGRAPSLQALVFHDRARLRELDAVIRNSSPDVIYLDGVRLGQYAPMLAGRGASRIVCDFDDLMSRRMRNRAGAGQPLALGYLGSHVPAFARRVLESRWIGGLVQAYEGHALAGLERRVARSCDCVVLVSSIEADQLRATVPGARVVAIPPFVSRHRAFRPLSDVQRFVFLGSSDFLQNRLTIDYLIDLWRRRRPAIPLHLYGTIRVQEHLPEAVELRGYCADLADVYTPGSVLLAPSFAPGGVKTKVLEAISHGVPAIGTPATFEGFPTMAADLCLDADELEAFVLDPSTRLAAVNAAARALAGQVMRTHSEQAVSAQWREVLRGPGRAVDTGAAVRSPGT